MSESDVPQPHRWPERIWTKAIGRYAAEEYVRVDLADALAEALDGLLNHGVPHLHEANAGGPTSDDAWSEWHAEEQNARAAIAAYRKDQKDG